VGEAGHIQSLKVKKQMPTGTIGRYFDQKGFGFIKPDEGEKDLFVHITEIKSEGVSTLTEGQRVTYEVVDGQKGPKAVNVEIDG
tara:strand:- start:2314 stop:2565 length:252 start_codon:yes stop_codon:yes gene_type:complete